MENLSELQQNKIDLLESTFDKVYDVIHYNGLMINAETKLGMKDLEVAKYWLIKGVIESENV